MISAEVSIAINRSVEDVWNFMADLKNTPKWDIGVSETIQTSAGPIGLGTTFHNIGPFMGKSTAREYKFIEFVPNKKVTVKLMSRAGNLRAAEVSYIVEPIETGTQLTSAGWVDMGKLIDLLRPIILPIVKKNIRGDLENVKRLLER